METKNLKYLKEKDLTARLLERLVLTEKRLVSIGTCQPWSEFIREHCSGLIDVEKVTAENKPRLTF